MCHFSSHHICDAWWNWPKRGSNKNKSKRVKQCAGAFFDFGQLLKTSQVALLFFIFFNVWFEMRCDSRQTPSTFKKNKNQNTYISSQNLICKVSFLTSSCCQLHPNMWKIFYADLLLTFYCWKRSGLTWECQMDWLIDWLITFIVRIPPEICLASETPVSYTSKRSPQKIATKIQHIQQKYNSNIRHVMCYAKQNIKVAVAPRSPYTN